MGEDDSKDLSSSNKFNADYKKYKIDEIIYKTISNGKDNDGKYSQIEMIFPSEKEIEIPLHRHSKEDITIYIIEGTFLIQYGHKKITGTSGMILKLEKRIEHSYKKVGNNKGKLLVFFTPAGFENCFRELNSMSTTSNNNEDQKILDKYDDRIKLHLLEKTYGLTFCG